MEKLKFKQIMSLTLTLFAVFFGAGNMVFPPAMGQLAGENYWQALIGFILTDAGIALLGIIAVVLVGNEITDLGNLVSKKFSIFLSIVVYLLIGPLFALPRTGSVSYELEAKPYVPSEYSWLVSLAVTAVFFAVTYFLSARPNKIVDIIGKYLTPILILSIVAIFFSCLFMDKSNHTVQYGATTATDSYTQGGAFFQGLIEGYNALDGPAGLVFAIIIINAVTGFGIKKRKNITKYTVICGIGAVIILSAIYFMLTYIGASTLTSFPNGGELLHAVTSDLLGTPGGIILGIAVLLACLTTSIGHIIFRLFPRVNSICILSKNRFDCVCLQFCNQQCRTYSIGCGFIACTDGSLSCIGCPNYSIFFQKMDSTQKNDICAFNGICILYFVYQWIGQRQYSTGNCS